MESYLIIISIKEIKYLSSLNDEDWNKISKKHINMSNHKLFNKEQGLKDLIDIKNVLDKNSVDFWLIGGTLLGAFRDHDFISWDDDVDVAVYEEDLLPKYDDLKKDFILSGFIFREIKKEMGTKITLLRYGIINTQKNSIDGLFLNKKYENDKYRLSRMRRHPRKFFENYKTMEFKGTTFRVPSPPEKYLSFMYNNWKKPIKDSRPEKEWRNKKIYWRKGRYR